jgi:arylformamidase
MKVYDVTLPITENMVVWPGAQPPKMKFLGHVDNGDHNTSSEVTFGTHTGTHLDAPLHFMKGGGTVGDLDINVLVGRARLFEAPSADRLTAAVFESLNIPAGTERVLVRTRNSKRWAEGHTEFDTNYVAVTADGAQWLVDHGVRLIGVDYLSVAEYRDTSTPHHILLGANVIPLEGLNLTGVPTGEYLLAALPMPLADRDGAPMRVVLIEGV